MKILFLDEMQQDYGTYYLFNGLCELLGEESLILYPFKLSYLGYTDQSYILYSDNNKRGMTCWSPYIKKRNLRIFPLEEVVEEMPNIDFIVLASPRYYPLHALRFIKLIYGGKIPKPVIFYDAEDSTELRVDLIEEFKPQIIFKRELTQSIENVYPLPFSSCLPYLPFWNEIRDKEKTLDVFALFGNTHHLRSETVKFLLEQNYSNSYVGIDPGALPWQDDNRFKIPPLKCYEDYLRTMASAKINIVIRGHGRDTVRYWEVASFKTLMLVKDPGIIIPYPYEDKGHCVYFDDQNDLKEKIDYYLVHDDEREKIADACYEHTMNFHTNEKSAEYFLKIIKEKL
jgi:hypothetical protein